MFMSVVIFDRHPFEGHSKFSCLCFHGFGLRRIHKILWLDRIAIRILESSLALLGLS